MTLVEVIAGLLILATVLASLLVARTRYTRQLLLANQRLAASKAVNTLLARWLDTPLGIPRDATGVLDTTPPMRWRSSVIRDRDAAELGMVIVRLRVLDPAQERASRNVAAASEQAREAEGRAPILSLDLLAPAQGGNIAPEAVPLPDQAGAATQPTPGEGAADADGPTEDPRLEEVGR